MTTDNFVERILSEYEKVTTREDTERAVLKDCIISDISSTDLRGALTRKLAARILHCSLQRLTDEPDDDWGPARNFKDIYDCRVCANAVAQVSVKGIMVPVAEDLFGMTEILSDSEAETAILRLFDSSKRVTIVLGLKNLGNR